MKQALLVKESASNLGASNIAGCPNLGIFLEGSLNTGLGPKAQN
jgi:hypothetical protein